MAGDTFDWNVVVKFATAGAREAGADLEKLEKTVDQLEKSQIKNERATKQSTQAIDQTGKAAKSASGGLKDLDDQAVRLRYANYDLARSMFTVSAAITAVGVGTTVASAAYESAFTAVERTSGVAGSAATQLRDDLIDLTRVIPQSFAEISNLAARGAQLGVATSELEDFTAVVAQFVATSDTVTLDQAVEAFGRISNLMGDTEFERIGSAITLVGVNAAATEAQIVKTTQELAPFATAVGMSTDEVIGLATAVASLGQPPERARSAFLTLQRVVDGAVNGLNDNLGQFANLLGLSEEAAAGLWATDPSGFISRFVDALGSVENLTLAFDALGISERRAVQVFQALAADARNAGNGMSVLDRALRDSNQGYVEATEMARQYALIQDDLASKWQFFVNEVMTLAASIGNVLAPSMKVALEVAQDLLEGLSGFINTPFGKAVIQLASVIGGLVATWAALRGGIALATASLFAFRTATASLGGVGIIAGLRALVSAFGLVRSGADAATRSTFTLTGALRALGRATIVLALLQAATALVFDFGGSMRWLADVATNVVNFIGTVFGQMVHFIADAMAAVSNIAIFPNFAGLKDDLRGASKEVRNFARDFEKVGLGDVAMGGFRDWAATLPGVEDDLKDLSDTAGGIPWDQFSEDADGFADSLDGVGDAAKEVRTLVDYANDLRSVFSRAFDIRFSAGTTLDAITSSFISMREATEESARNIRSLKAEISGLQSDLSIQQYFLGIAVEYGDAKRAEAIQANIAKLQADLADKQAALTEEQAKNSRELTGNTKAAIENRSTITGLVAQYQAHIQALAASGMEQGALAAATEQLRQDFIAQATQLGYNQDELAIYTQAFDDVRVAIENVPRDINVDADTDPAIQALKEFLALAAASRAEVPVTASNGFGTGRQWGNEFGQGAQTAMQQWWNSQGGALGIQLLTGSLSSAWRNGTPRYGGSGSFDGGGYTGRGHRLEPAGIVHRGEYVVPKHQVNQRTGLPYADALGRLQKGATGRTSYARGGFVNPGPQQSGRIDSFGPMAQMQLQQALHQIITLDSGAIAGSVSHSNTVGTAIGRA